MTVNISKKNVRIKKFIPKKILFLEQIKEK